MKKRFLCALLAAMMIASLTACGKSGDSSKTDSAAQTEAQTQTTQAETASTAAGNADTTAATDSTESADSAVETMLPGVLYFPNVKDGETPLITGITINGNRSGAGQDDNPTVNFRKPSLEDIRFIYELNEWIEAYPQFAAKPEAFKMFAVKHQKDVDAYKTMTFAELSENNFGAGEFNENEEDKSQEYVALNISADNPTGLYDLVFTDGDKIVAVMPVKLFPTAELEGKSDKELEAIMQTELAAVAAQMASTAPAE